MNNTGQGTGYQKCKKNSASPSLEAVRGTLGRHGCPTYKPVHHI